MDDKEEAKVKSIKEKYKETEGLFEKLKPTSPKVSSLSQRVVDCTHLVSMKDLTRLAGEITDYSSEKISAADDFIKKNPFSFIAGAVGVGILIGIFINRLK